MECFKGDQTTNLDISNYIPWSSVHVALDGKSRSTVNDVVSIYDGDSNEKYVWLG